MPCPQPADGNIRFTVSTSVLGKKCGESNAMITLLMVPETSKPTAGLVADVELNRGPKPKRNIHQSYHMEMASLHISETSSWIIMVQV